MTTSLPITRLLSDLREAGVELAVRDGRLLYRPKAVAPSIAARIAAHKDAMIGAVAAAEPAELVPALPVDIPRHRHEPCRWCRQSLWWALRLTDPYWTCGYCHPPAAHLGRVFWRGEDAPTVTVTGVEP